MDKKDKFFRKLQMKFAGYKPQSSQRTRGRIIQQPIQQFKTGKQFLIDQFLYKFYLQYKGIQLIKKHLQNLTNRNYNSNIKTCFEKIELQFTTPKQLQQRKMLDKKCLLAQYQYLDRYKQQISNLQTFMYQAGQLFLENLEISQHGIDESKLIECISFVFNEEGKLNSMKQALFHHLQLSLDIDQKYRASSKQIQAYLKNEKQVYKDIAQKLQGFQDSKTLRTSRKN